MTSITASDRRRSNPHRLSVNGLRTPPPTQSNKHSKRGSWIHRQTGSVSYGQADMGTVLSPIKGSLPSEPSHNTLGRNSLKPAPLNITTTYATSNGNSNGTPITPVKQANTFPRSRVRGKSNASTDPSEGQGHELSYSLSVKSSNKSTKGKDKRASFFTSGGGSLGRQSSVKKDFGDESWMTESESRLSTNVQSGGGEMGEVKNGVGGGGGLKKRLSLLRLGKKQSKISVNPLSVAEEE